MKRVLSVFKKIDYRHYVCVGITVAFVLVNIFCFPYTFPRLGEAFRDFGLSVGFHYANIFQIENNIMPSVTSLSAMPYSIDFLPATWEEFKTNWTLYWDKFVDVQTFFDYIVSLKNVGFIFSYIVSILVPVIVLVVVLISVQLNKQDNFYNLDSKPLKLFKKLSDKTYRPVKAWISDFINFVKTWEFVLPAKEPKPGEIVKRSGISYLKIWAFIWILNCNVIPVLIESLAFLYYFVVSYDVGNIYIQVYKMLLDLSVIGKFIPPFGWFVIALIVFDKIRKKMGYDKLWHHELMNRGFINERGVFSLIVAPMRAGKTKASVAMALSREVMFRDMAYEIILKSDLKFPYFPWINFENCLKAAMDKGSVYNLATCRRFVKSKKIKFYKRPKQKYIFDYDFERYGLEYDNKKYIENLFDVLNDYAQAYFIYIIQSSLIVSNYSIRVDDIIEDIGNFPLRHADFFKTDSRLIEALSRHSHIVDYDSLRLGKKISCESKFAFEFGVIDITEIAKERLNQIESQGLKKTDIEANQLNDGFNDWVKMCGHNATIDYKCFVSIYCDDQREQNLPASLREVGEILRIEEAEKDFLAMPGFFMGELLYSLSHRIISNLHKKIRYNQGGNSLLYYILHTIFSKIESYYQRIYNIFGYEVLKISVQDGAQNNDKILHKFFISNKKDLSLRYSTDCLSDLLAVRSLRAIWGFDELPSYIGTKATFEELEKQNSFFVNGVSKQLKVSGSKKQKMPIAPKVELPNRKFF